MGRVGCGEQSVWGYFTFLGNFFDIFLIILVGVGGVFVFSSSPFWEISLQHS